MVGFKEAVVYGKAMFGKDFDCCRETDDGWLGFFLKSDPGVAYESQTWDEFEAEWRRFSGSEAKRKTRCGKGRIAA